jgi:hypothetical protein
VPANAVKTPADEKRWAKAKTRAADQGHGEDWAYVMGVYKRMKSASEDLLGDAMAYAAAPSQNAWRKVSDKVLQSRGPATYTTPLVPGFEGSMADEVLMLPTESQYEDQVEAGETPRYVYNPEEMQRRGALARANRVVTQIAKMAAQLSWETEDLSREGYGTSAERERAVSDGVDRAWQQNEADDPGSSMPEPSGKNRILTGNTWP